LSVLDGAAAETHHTHPIKTLRIDCQASNLVQSKAAGSIWDFLHQQTIQFVPYALRLFPALLGLELVVAFVTVIV